MIEQLIPRVIAMHTMALKAHWRTASDSQHRALGEFYEGVIPALDVIVELHQTMFGPAVEAEKPDLPSDFVSSAPEGAPYHSKQIASAFREEAEWIEANRDIICSGVSAIGNLVDNLTAVYLKAASKLERLG